MRNDKITTLLIMTLVCLMGIAFAQSPEGKNEPAIPEKSKDMPMGKAGMGGMMKMDMMKMMMQKQMVASADGGVIVLIGNKLLKYDKNLNLIKEVELKTDVEYMHKMMQKMKEKCQMQGKMMKQEGQQEDQEKESKE